MSESAVIYQEEGEATFASVAGGASLQVKEYTRNGRAEKGSVQQLTTKAGGFSVKSWGVQNDLPQLREALVCHNNIVAPLIATKRDIILGQELIAYKKRFEDGKTTIVQVEIPPAAADFFENIDVDSFLRTNCRELLFHANTFTEFVRFKRDGRKIKSMKAHKCKHIRAEEMNSKGVVMNYIWSGHWAAKKKRSKEKGKYTKIPVYNGSNSQGKFILHRGDDLCGDDYYYEPSWWGGRTWIELANCIPEFHYWNMKHGYTLRWHVQIPKGFFLNKAKFQKGEKFRKEALAEEKIAKAQFQEKCNKYLAGIENTGRAVFTDYDINKNLGKEYSGIKIQALSADLKDEALLKLFEKSNQANMSAQGVHPTLANIETAGKLSSGSEIRSALQAYIATKTPQPRKILLKDIHFVKKENGWPKDVFYGFKDLEITSLDTDKSGSHSNVTSV